MNIQEFIKKQGWKEQKESDIPFSKVYEFDEDYNTLKIVFSIKSNEDKINELKDRLWNNYYSRILIYKSDEQKYKIWSNNQAREKEKEISSELDFNERISPIEYWSKYIPKSYKNAVDWQLIKNITDAYMKISENKDKEKSISIILACTFIRFLEDREITDIKIKITDALESINKTSKLFKEYNKIHNGVLFKNDVLSILDKKVCNILKDMLENKMFKQMGLFDFNFKYIPIELISNIYEELLIKKEGKEKATEKGVAYTPPRLATFIVKRTFRQLKKNNQNFSNFKICDLSAGSGIFLVLSFRELLKELRIKTFEKKVNVLKNSLYGFDIDSSAVKIAVFSLYIELLEGTNKKLSAKNRFPDLKNINKQDSLKYLKCEDYFSLVIGNPPWNSRDKESFKKIESRKFNKNIGNKETAEMFVHIGLEKLKPGGVLAMVLPSSSFYKKVSANFRNSILEQAYIKDFIDFSPIRSKVFKNSVPASVLVIEKKQNKDNNLYIIPMRRVLNEGDYLYFNHISGATNNIDNHFLQSRNDSWQIAIRGGNSTALFIDRLNQNYLKIGDVIKNNNIITGYQGTKGKTIRNDQSNTHSIKLISYSDGEIKYFYTNLQKSSESHKGIEDKFLQNNCLLVLRLYKGGYTERLNIVYKSKNCAFSEYFVGFLVEDIDLLYFLSALFKSRFSIFLINMMSATMPLSSKEQKDYHLYKQDLKKLPIPKNYSDYKYIIKLGKEFIEKGHANNLQKDIDTGIEQVYKISYFDKKIIEQWEIITKRKEVDDQEKFNRYKKGFKYMLNSFELPIPKKWSSQIIKGVQVIGFSGNNILPEINNKIIRKSKIHEIIVGQKEFHSKFISGNHGFIMRKESTNFGFLTGASDAESILSSL